MELERRRAYLAAALLAGGSLATFALLIHLGRGLTFFFDEWDFIQHRRNLGLESLFRPHNGHLSVLPVLAYQVLFRSVGLADYQPYLLMIAGLHLAVVWLMFFVVKRRAGSLAALLSAGAILFLGRAWQDILWPFQIGFLGALAFGLLAMLAMDRTGRHADLQVGGCLLAGLGCSGIGLPVLVAVSVELLASAGWRRTARVLLLPVSAYGVWYLAQGTSQASASNVSLVPGHVGRSAAGVMGALAGVDPGFVANSGATLGGGLLLWLVARRRWSPRLLGAVSGMLVFWALTSLARGPLAEPTASRYLYPGAVFAVLALVEAGRLAPRPAQRWLPWAVVPVALWAAWANVEVLRQGAAGLRETSEYVAAALGGLEEVGPPVPPAFKPDNVRAPQIEAGPYFEAVADLGSPATKPAALARGRPLPRAAADAVMLRSLMESARANTVKPSDHPMVQCKVIGDDEPLGTEITLKAPTVLEQAEGTSASIWLRRFSDIYQPEPLLRVPSGLAAFLDVPGPGASREWRARAETKGPFRACE